jgi:hypothetical protein
VRRGRFMIRQDDVGPLRERMRMRMGPSLSIGDVVEVDGMCVMPSIAIEPRRRASQMFKRNGGFRLLSKVSRGDPAQKL